MKKSKIAAGVLAILLGGIGVHKFYLGKIGMGIVYLLFCWTGIPAIIGLIEGIIILVQSDDEFVLKYNVELDENPNYGGNLNKADELLKWKSLYESGDITSEEYDRFRERLLK